MGWLMNGARMVLALVLCVLGGTAASGAPGWPPTQCGREPAPPSVETSTVERYNGSVDRVTLYERQARAYDACVSRTADTAQRAISNDAGQRIAAIQDVRVALQRRIAANFTALGTALRNRPPAAR